MFFIAPDRRLRLDSTQNDRPVQYHDHHLSAFEEYRRSKRGGLSKVTKLSANAFREVHTLKNVDLSTSRPRALRLLQVLGFTGRLNMPRS